MTTEYMTGRRAWLLGHMASEAAGRGAGLAPEAWGWAAAIAHLSGSSGHHFGVLGVSPPCPRPVCWARRARLCTPLSLVASDVSFECKWKSVGSHLPPSTVHIVSATSCLLRRCGLCRFQIKLVKKTVLALTMLMFYLPWRREFQSGGFLSLSL